jgi:PAS domain S-box-containing protein
MSTPDFTPEDERLTQELQIQRQIAFASGLFQGDITIRTLLESLAEGVIIIDKSGTILLVNTRVEKMFGYPKQDLIGQPHSVLLPERFREVHEEHQAGFFKEPRIRPMGQLLDLAGRRRDGSEFPVEISLSFIETIIGVLVLAFISDITLRKRYESSLQESEKLAHMLVEGMKDYAIFMLDAQGNVQSWNAGAELLKGYRAEEITGKHFSCFYPEEDRAGGKPTKKNLKMAANEERDEEEGWLVRKDGSRFWANVVITALRDENGNLCGFSNVTRDISERKRAEEEIRNSEEKLHYSATAADIGIWRWDLVNNELTWSERCKELFGYPPDYPMTYDAFLSSIHEEDRSHVDRAVHKALQEKTEYLIEMRVVLPDGRLRWVMSKGRGFFDDEGKPVCMHGIAMDITERKRVEMEIKMLNTSLAARTASLEDANRELEAFNYTAAHDLRQPLTVICSCCQVIKELCGDKLDEECRGYLQESYEGAFHMNRLIDALLNFSRMGHVEPRREMVDLSELAHEIVMKLKVTDLERQVDFRIADGIVANADATLLRMVLDNLIGNAWKYTGMREKAVIEFGVSDFDGVPKYFIRDNGAGFNMADKEKLFIPFQRLSSAGESKGFGIGLSTVDRIIRRHGGKIWAEGESGKGATFYFTLSAAGISN